MNLNIIAALICYVILLKNRIQINYMQYESYLTLNIMVYIA